jgi:hypothetical protein
MSVAVLGRFDSVRTAAGRSGGFVTTAELKALGVPKSTVSRWGRNGLLIRVRRGVYRVGGQGFGFEEALHLAQKVMNEQQAIGARSALAVWDMPGGGRGRVHVVGPKGCNTGSSLLSIVEVRDLRPADMTTRNGLRVTTATRSIIDASRYCSPEKIGEQLTDGVNRRLFTYDQVALRLSEVSRPGKRGIAKLRDVLATRIDDPGRQLNSYERAAKKLFLAAGCPMPVSQFHVATGERSYFVDFAWPESCLLVECDSMLAHSTPEQLQSDLRRQNDLISLGWTLVRFTYWDVVDRPDYVGASLMNYFLDPRTPRTG